MTKASLHMLKGVGYLISTVTVILLAIVSWSSASTSPVLTACLLGGGASSIVGMFCRWLTYEIEKRRGGRAIMSRRPLHALWRRACTLLYSLPKPFAHFAVQGDKSRADITASTAFGHQCEGGLSDLALDAKQLEFVDSESLRLQPGCRVAAAIFAALALRNHTLQTGPIDEVEDCLGVVWQGFAELDALSFSDCPPTACRAGRGR
ncbi:hypothetical protein [Mesorhizobium sp. M0578]|uniref:hypothetical protein n=1 Tax=unclassified Mesorhizobium TaxID=325217 RepID=UPI00333D9856